MTHNRKPKTVLCLQSNAGFGRCSTAMIQPTLAVLGCQPVMLPTVTLSTHLGGLGTPARLDSTDFSLQALEHYARLGVRFDCIFSGFLGNAQQAELVQRAFALWPQAYKIVDPAMADHGRLYSGITPQLFDAMRQLCCAADLILPNYTEAHLLLDRPLADPDAPVSAADALVLADALTALAPAVLVTGLPMGQDVGCCGSGSGMEHFVQCQPLLTRSYHGTGDLFAAVLAGTLLQGSALAHAAQQAAAFVADAIRNTPADEDERLGVWFEPLLGQLAAQP